MMEDVELKINTKDWYYISFLGAIFGLLFSIFLYFMENKFQYVSVILFGPFSGFIISLFASFFITLSNNFVLPLVKKKFWYLISFLFSFFAGSFGFLLSFFFFYLFNVKIVYIIEPYTLYLTLITGFLTFFIGLILHQFIAMKYKNEAIKNEILDARIKSIENELNPHFLFNALNSVSELIYQNPKKAEQSILHFSGFLRNAITTKSLISIQDELEMVSTYVEIENIRFSDKIKLHINSLSPQSITIPKFSIQLLVENAIKHGFIGRILNITITVNKNITVTNDGKKPKKIKFGTGLKNLNDRLRFFKIGFLEYAIDDNTEFTIRINDAHISC